MITPGDEYPLHQSSRPFRDPGSDRNLYDRFFFNAYARDLSSYVAVALGQYPGRDVMDAAISIVVGPAGGRVQHNVRASRVLGGDRLATAVGPIRVEIVEPLRRLRVVVDDESGLAADLTFTARAAPFEEPHYRWVVGHRTIFDITRMTQNGTWTGTFQVPGGDEVTVGDDTWWGTRDRSWGIRPVGEHEAAGAPAPGRQGFYWLWAPIQTDDSCYLFDVNEHPDGSRWHASAMRVPVGGSQADVEEGTATYTSVPRPGSRHSDGFEITMDLPSGRHVLTLEPTFDFLMQGIGYTHPEWGHGTYKGKLAGAYDTYDLDGYDEGAYTHQHIQSLCAVRRGDGVEGVGILEQLVIGPHDPSGLTDLLDLY